MNYSSVRGDRPAARHVPRSIRRPRSSAGHIISRLLLAAAVLATTVLATAAPASATVLGGFHQLMNRQSSECLDVAGAAGYNGAEVKIWRCVGAANQRWQPIDQGSGFFLLQVEHTGKCLAYQGARQAWANVVQDVCTPGADVARQTSWQGPFLAGLTTEEPDRHGKTTGAAGRGEDQDRVVDPGR